MRTSSQSSSEPSCPPQNAESLYCERQRRGSSARDVREREVVPDEARDEHERRDERREERREERVPRRVREPRAAPARAAPSGDERVDRQPEGDERAPRGRARPSRLGRDTSAAWYFDGHFVIIEPGVVTKVPSACRLPSTTTSRPVRKRSGTGALVEHRDALLVPPSMSSSRKRMPAPCGSPEGVPTTRPASDTSPVFAASSLGETDGVPPPASDV